MLEVDDVMRLYFVLLEGVFVVAVLDELPQTLGLVLVDDVDPSSQRLFDAGPILRKIISSVLLLELGHFVGSVEDN